MIRRLFGKAVLWALSIESIRAIAVRPGEKLVLQLPWWVGERDSFRFSRDVGNALGGSIIVLPYGSEMYKVRVEEKETA